jgi:hypothetical protein
MEKSSSILTSPLLKPVPTAFKTDSLQGFLGGAPSFKNIPSRCRPFCEGDFAIANASGLIFRQGSTLWRYETSISPFAAKLTT